MPVTAYVVIDEPCQNCTAGYSLMVTPVVSIPGTNAFVQSKCATCHGTGTVQRRVTCETCRYAKNYSGVRDDYQCAQLPVGLYAEDDPHVDGDWGCASWEAKP